MQAVADLAVATNYKIKGLQVIVSMEVQGNHLIEDDAILYQLPIK